MRKALVFPVRFVAEGQSVQTTSRDLDEETVFVRCVEPPEVGDRVVLRLYLPGISAGDSIEARVEEAASEGFRARFEHLSDEAREHLKSALQGGAKAASRRSSRGRTRAKTAACCRATSTASASP